MNDEILEFERPVVELERRIADLRAGAEAGDMADEIAALSGQVDLLRRGLVEALTDWQRVQLARHPMRPLALDYIERIFTDFTELHGDRRFADDAALVAGLARLHGDGAPAEGQAVVVLGQQRGRTTKENISRRFAMANPEGYRKARRVMELGGRFGLPVLTFIDTPGAYPGIGAEERGQAEAIATNLEFMATLPVPIVATVIGQGGSGGALAIGVADRVLMLEYATYAVISPEGCASILWRDPAKAPEAAAAMRTTAPAIRALGVADDLVPEPPGGAHRDAGETAAMLGGYLRRHLADLCALPTAELLERRYRKLRALGAHTG